MDNTIPFTPKALSLLPEGYIIENLTIPSDAVEALNQYDYAKLDQIIIRETSPGGIIFQKLNSFLPLREIEFIISVREEDNEDGIWHDDGSRPLAFSLSLTQEKIEGGILELRQKGELQSQKIQTPIFGEIIIFHTGQMGYEHKINRVTKGTRTIIAGWCYL